MSKSFILLILVAGLCVACKKNDDAVSSTAATNTSASGSPITAPVDYLGAVAKAQKTANKTLDSAALNQATQLFYAQEGRYPKDLNELVKPGYLSRLPQPPAGMKYEYNAANGQVKVVPQ